MAERRVLVQAVVVEYGHTVSTVTPRGSGFDLVITSSLLDRTVPVLLRLSEDPFGPSAHDEAAGDALRAGCATHLLLGGAADAPEVMSDVRYRSLSDLVRLLEDSALLSWDKQSPSPDKAAYVAWRESQKALAEADPSGLRWMRALSLNKYPADLRESGTTPETWFEEALFRVGSRVLGLRGRRLGASRPGTREPDGFFVHPDQPGQSRLGLWDAKAARDGFTMDVAEERKLLEYAGRSWTWQGQALPASTVVIISSHFPASEKSFEDRRDKFKKAGSDLAYLSADAVLALALPFTSDPDGPEAARRVDWAALLGHGQVTTGQSAAAAAAALVEARRSREADEAP